MPSYPPVMACELRPAGAGRWSCECGATVSNPAAKLGPCPAKRARAAGDSFTAPDVVQRPTIDERVEAHGPEVVEVWGLAKRAKSLARELGRWLMAGCPRRSPAEQNAIAAICRACPKVRVMSSGAIRCSICGCATGSGSEPPSHEEHALKLLIATTHCPDNPPRW